MAFFDNVVIAAGARSPQAHSRGVQQLQAAEVVPRPPWVARELDAGRAEELSDSSALDLGTARSTGSMLSEFPALFPSQVYAIGGADETVGTLSSAERFDSASCVWEPVAPLLVPRESCAAVAASGMIYVLGGVSGDAHCLASVERFEPSTGVWEQLPSMRCARSAAAAVSVAGRDGFMSLDSVERLDAGGRGWEVLPPLRSARFGAAAAVLGGLAYVLGGKGGGRVLDTAERLDLEAGFWESL
eukprot:CAMPEP_0175781814 /NCGR_PEP_ID=MMETSP0097-20121207/77461_1 /TAXON_ID=311494 /ORGANISM="Alexandrium monilatum, Strain CCMP3105" /LENGTH=243 /DNA_ID=CAMNT_0017092615 /DNA_START=132 /DNA_END=859 /DNA_ORIENTATION=-